MLSGCCSQRRVLLSMSVKREAMVPVGSSATSAPPWSLRLVDSKAIRRAEHLFPALTWWLARREPPPVHAPARSLQRGVTVVNDCTGTRACDRYTMQRMLVAVHGGWQEQWGEQRESSGTAVRHVLCQNHSLLGLRPVVPW